MTRRVCAAGCSYECPPYKSDCLLRAEQQRSFPAPGSKLYEHQSQSRVSRPIVKPEIKVVDHVMMLERIDDKLKRDLQSNDVTLPACLGNNNLSQGRFEFLGEHQGMR